MHARRPTLERPALLVAPLLACACSLAGAQSLRAPWVDLEVQRADFSRNDLQKPNDASGTRFSALPFTGDRATTGRLSAELPVKWWGEGHRLRLTYAPLSLEGSSVPTSAIGFQGSTFAAGVPTTLKYTFDTWRATYSVPLFGREDPAAGWALRAGGTLAIRDAQIRLTQGGTSQTFDNVGPVPLLHLSAARGLGAGWAFEAELDGAPGPGGAGLWDGAARLRWSPGAAWSFAAGLRHLRGGVNTDEIYNSVSATSATASMRFSF
jgi:hypothetical protein